MEELRSTEILDKEIQADARKKAEKILAKADVDCDLIKAEVAERIEKAKCDLFEKNNSKLAAFERDQNASLPLEKERFLVSFIQSALNSASDEYLSELSEEKQLELCLGQIRKNEAVLKSKKLNAYVYGFNKELVKKVVGKRFDLNEIFETEYNKLIVENDCGIKTKKGVILEAVDKSVRVRLTLSETISQIQDKYRFELYEALFGGNLNSAAGGSN